MADLSFDYLLIGGGRTSANAAQSIRSIDKTGTIAIVAAENRKPYDRPPLSKNFLVGRPPNAEDVESKPDDFFEVQKVELLKGVAAQSIDRNAKTVTLADGRAVAYGKLLIATGARPRILDLPGAEGVLYLRTADDAIAIRDRAKQVKNVTVIGSGFIGTEVASWLADAGAETTVVGREAYPWEKFLSSTSGNFLKNYLESKGVRLHMNAKPTAIEGKDVVLEDGSRIMGDAVVAGLGVDLNTEIAAGAGLQLDEKNAIKTDSKLRTDDPNIWAAGDVAAFEDKTAGKRWHAEHYMNATWQGEQVGKNMAGEESDYDKVAYFFSDMFDISFVLRGDAQSNQNPVKVIGDVDGAEFIELFADSNGKLVMGLAFTRDSKKQDLISDKLEEAILAGRPASELDESHFVNS